MKCVQVTKIGKTFDEAIDYLALSSNVPIPEPGSKQVLVKVKVASLNFLDTLVIQNKYQIKYKPPFTPGVECAGVVVKVGKKITSFKVGDRVLGSPTFPYGAFGEYTVCSPMHIWKMPDNMSFADGASFATIYGTAYMALIQRAQLLSHINATKTANNVLVTAGAGGLGTACIQIANCFKKSNGFNNIEHNGTGTNPNGSSQIPIPNNYGLSNYKNVGEIVACVGNTQFDIKSKIVKECGADRVINYTTTPEWGKMLKKKENITFDIICDMVGGTAFAQGLKCINHFGKLIVLGFAGGNIPTVKVNKLLLNSCDVIGCAWGATSFVDYPMFKDSLTKALQLYENGWLKPVIGKTYQFNENGIKTAFNDLANRRSVGKLLINIDDTNTQTFQTSKL